LLLVLLFQSSTVLTETITAGKYPEYSNYQRAVGMFVPKSISSYRTQITQPSQPSQPALPKVIRTSEIAKKLEKREKQNQKQKQKQK
jgi:hypothetical protein